MEAAAPERPASAAALFAQIASAPHAWLALKVAGGLLLLIAGIRIGRWLADFGMRLMLRAHVDRILAEFLRNATQGLLLAIIVISALDLTGFPTTSLLTALGAAGLAIGLALKDSLSHIAAGVVLIVLRPFRVGDAVNIAGQDGVVEGIHILQTRLHTFDNRDLTFMNGAVVAAPIFNYSQRPNRRSDLSLTLAHEVDLARALATARELVAADDRILDDPAPSVAVSDITERGIVVAVQVWSAAALMGAVRSDLLVALQRRLREQGVEFARAYAAPSTTLALRAQEQRAVARAVGARGRDRNL